MLLDLPPESRVLILGTPLCHWSGIFRNSTILDGWDGLLADLLPYDLILYHASCARNMVQFRAQLEVLKKLSDEAGRVLIFAPNFYSVKNLMKFKRLLRWPFGRNYSCSRAGYRRVLAAAGFSRLREYITFPGIEAAEEIVLPGSKFVELPNNWHPLYLLAQRLKIYPSVADGYIFAHGMTLPDQSALLRAVAEQISPSEGGEVSLCVLERFDLRLRGALVLFVSESLNRRNVIVRVVSDPQVCKIVRRNQNFLVEVQAITELPDPVCRLLPSPLAEFTFSGHEVFIESLKEGILAWKANRSSLRKRIYHDATRFIWSLQLATRRPTQYDSRVIDRLFAEDLGRLDSGAEVATRLRCGLLRALEGIRGRLDGWSGYLVASHGDYGYGNILVDPDRGNVTGVIDWDTGKLYDLPGLDLLNLEVQKVRIEQGAGVYDAFVCVSRVILGRGSLDVTGAYNAEFGITTTRVSALIYACLLRYLCRAAQYPEVFVSEQEDYLRTLDYLNKVAPL